jgi:hypothetical protein
MKTEKELNELNNAIGKAVFAYHNAIAENLKESGREHRVVGYEDEDEEGLRVEIIGRHNDAVSMVVDRIRYNNEHNSVEVHICEEDYRKQDYWVYISTLGDAQDYVNLSIEW